MIDLEKFPNILLRNDTTEARIHFDMVRDFLKINADFYGDISKENVMHLIGKAFDDCFERKTGKETTK